MMPFRAFVGLPLLSILRRPGMTSVWHTKKSGGRRALTTFIAGYLAACRQAGSQNAIVGSSAVADVSLTSQEP
jgi:hypothetical protein